MPPAQLQLGSISTTKRKHSGLQQAIRSTPKANTHVFRAAQDSGTWLQISLNPGLPLTLLCSSQEKPTSASRVR